MTIFYGWTPVAFLGVTKSIVVMYFGGQELKYQKKSKLGREGRGSGNFDYWPMEHGNDFISPTACILCPPTHFTYELPDME